MSLKKQVPLIDQDDILYPPIRPRNTDKYFETSDGQSIYYELCGNPKGFPVVYVHGGPGAGCSGLDRRYFDPDKWNILLYDQRGCGNSAPGALDVELIIKNNDTDQLVADLVELLDYLHFDRVVLFGGSWGSTLALVFAILHSERVAGLILRGIFLGEEREIQDMYVNGNVARYFPEVWNRYISLVPQEFRHDPPSYYLKMMKDGDDQERAKYAYEFCLYESSLIYIDQPSTKQLERIIKKDSNYFFCSVLEAWYINMSSRCFIPEGFILNAIHAIKHIPTTIIQGRHDFICGVESAFRLKEVLGLRKADFHVTGGSHSSRDIHNMIALVKETDRMYGRVIKGLR